MPAPEPRARSEEQRWEASYQELLPRVFHYFAYRVGDSAVAEDLTAETFARAWRARGRYRKDLGKLTAWIFGFARNVSKEHFRNPRHPEAVMRDPAAGQGRPAEEAAIQYFWERRGGFWVHEGDRICQNIYYGDMEDSSTSSAPEPAPVAEGLAILDYPVSLPTWVPDGFELVESMPPPATPHSWVYLHWTDAAMNLIYVTAAPAPTEFATGIAPEGSLEVLEINGRDALLIRGGCAFPDPEELVGLRSGTPFRTEWVETMASLTLRDDSTEYWLMIAGPYATAEDLVRMAESIP